MTTQPANMKPNGPDEVTSLVIVKTIMEHRLDDLLEMANQADNALKWLKINEKKQFVIIML